MMEHSEMTSGGKQTPRPRRSLDLPVRGLQGLFGTDMPACGPLSPLARLPVCDGPADPEALASIWESLQGEWIWSVPALLDPHRVIAVIFGDGNSSFVGQYVFPDDEAHGPGFLVEIHPETVRLTGPVSLEEVRAGLFPHLSLELVADPEPARIEVAADHFWTLTACLDACCEVALARRLLRLPGVPAGVDAGQIAKAWANGIASPDPGWSVSLFRRLAPARVPDDFASRLPQLLDDMVREGALRKIVAPDLGEPLFAVPGELNRLSGEFVNRMHFGLVSQVLGNQSESQISLVGGWLTPDGVWLADLGDLDQEKVSLACVSPDVVVDLMDQLIGRAEPGPREDGFTMETVFDLASLVSRLRDLSSPGRVPVHQAPGFCPRCGGAVSADARFCRSCGANLQSEQRS